MLEVSTKTVSLALRGNYKLLAMKNVDRERGNGKRRRRIISKKHSRHYLNNVTESLVVTSDIKVVNTYCNGLGVIGNFYR